MCVKPKPAAALFWKFLVLGFGESLLHKDSNPTIFRVSRILLESINRPVNIEKHTRYFGEELTAFKEAIFRVYSFPLFYFREKYYLAPSTNSNLLFSPLNCQKLLNDPPNY